jgi:hypothetical protein
MKNLPWPFKPILVSILLTGSTVVMMSCSDDTIRPGSKNNTPKGWQEMISGTVENLNDVWGFGDDDVLAVGDNGTILYYDGTSWTRMNSGTTCTLNGIHGDSFRAIVTGDSGTILVKYGNVWHREGIQFSEEPIGAVWYSEDIIYALGGGPPGTILVNSENQHYWEAIETGASGKFMNLTAFSDYYRGIYPLAVLVGKNGTAYWGSEYIWNVMDTATNENLAAVFGECPSNMYAVSSGGKIFQNTSRFAFGGSNLTWREIASLDGEQFHDLAARSYNDIFIVGENGRIVHFDRCKYTEMTTNSTVALRAVWCGETDVFAVGDNGTILHYSDPPAEPACPVNVNLSVSGGTTPTISWTPPCPIAKLVIEDQTGVVEWFIACDGNLIQPEVEYGAPPDCAVEFCPRAYGLIAGEWYRASLIRRDWDNEYVVGSWNILPQESESARVVKAVPSSGGMFPDWAMKSSAGNMFDKRFFYQRLLQSISGQDIYMFGGVVAIGDWGRGIPDPAVREEELYIRPVIVERLVRNPETGQQEVITYLNIRAAGSVNAPVVWDILPVKAKKEFRR